MFNRNKVRKLKEQLAVAQATLNFYAYPFGRREPWGDRVSVPDFYSELSFGDRANVALAEMDEIEYLS